MFQGIVNRAQHSVELLAGKILTRVAVAVPFVLAAVFGMIAAIIWLSQNYGSLIAYLTMAGVFALIGLFAAIFSALSASSVEPMSAAIAPPESSTAENVP